MLWETVRLAFRAIRRNVLRSVLTVLGVVIGVAAVIAMVTVGQGSSDKVSADVASLGTNVLVLRPGQPRMGPGPRDNAPEFTIRNAEALASLSSIAAIAPTASSSQTVVAGNSNISTTITGTTNGYLTVANWPLVLGRSFTEAENNGSGAVCILGETVRQALFGAADPTDQTIRVKAVSCQVIGVLAVKGASSFGQDQDDTVLMPIRTVQRRLAGNNDVSNIRISLAPGISTERGIRDIEALMRQERRIGIGQTDNFNVSDMAEIASMLTGINSVLTGLLSSVAAVSLLVGGIGIMNIMLVSVTERTREIGIRLAVGAQASQVLMQFLVEAVVLSVLGGTLGIGVGLALAAVAASFMSIPFSPDAGVVALAFGFSALIGVIFGYFPARSAARLDPIDALRHQ
ncbi:MAG: multidrug ABC transporter substrate-binding protein [Cereibacter sphaeroides]|uniref:Multidrug ABC transporter substrate-binding protein n=1 Tax=Cereibacter sphaeroides TaxID=1063 RepID=A0A2W5SEC3_CERSP|nr:MAG: multidrug ABC transporter substrate-binding protein [Cereibacter sphaeroides]